MLHSPVECHVLQTTIPNPIPAQAPEVPSSRLVPSAFDEACLFERTGRVPEAEARYRHLLTLDPAHVEALNNLGNLLLASGRDLEAQGFYQRAVAVCPKHLASRANLGNTLMKRGQAAAAAEQFLAALELDPRYRPSHAGLSFALAALGDPEAAARHRREAFAGRAIVSAAYRGDKPPITVLELVSTLGGNLRTDPYLSDRVFHRILVATEFFEPGTPLPPHQLVVNAVGDADLAAEALEGAARVVASTSAPVINPPAAVQATSRCQIAERLALVPGVRTARTVLLPREALESPTANDLLASHQIPFPLLLRRPGTHGGEQLLRVRSAQALPRLLEELPGDRLLAVEFLEHRSPDGKYRKYRVMIVDGKLFPLHLAISSDWKIHYFSADMAENPAHRQEDANFLADMPAVLGPAAIAALEKIAQTLALDYAGIDFALGPFGEVIVFEANATMTVVVPGPEPIWNYRRPAVETIFRAVWKMLQGRALPIQRAGQN